MSDLTLDALVEDGAEAQWEAARAGLRGQRYAFLDVPWSEAPADLRAVELGCARAVLAAVAKRAGGADALRYTDGVIEDSYNHAVDEMRHTRVAALLRTLAEAAHDDTRSAGASSDAAPTGAAASAGQATPAEPTGEAAHEPR